MQLSVWGSGTSSQKFRFMHPHRNQHDMLALISIHTSTQDSTYFRRHHVGVRAQFRFMHLHRMQLVSAGYMVAKQDFDLCTNVGSNLLNCLNGTLDLHFDSYIHIGCNERSAAV